jgi:hypothetical protein
MPSDSTDRACHASGGPTATNFPDRVNLHAINQFAGFSQSTASPQKFARNTHPTLIYMPRGLVILRSLITPVGAGFLRQQ